MVRDLPLSPALESALRRCRATCRETLDLYAERGTNPDGDFSRSLLAVIAAVEVVLDAEPRRRKLRIAAAAQIVRAAAAQIRGYGLDEPVLRCAAACDEVAHRCTAALAGDG